MKNAIKKIFVGIYTTALFLLLPLATFGTIVLYIESFKAVGILAVLFFVGATINSAFMLYAYWSIGDAVMDAVMIAREKNTEQKEPTT